MIFFKKCHANIDNLFVPLTQIQSLNDKWQKHNVVTLYPS
jgi:hypothetical protein